MTFPVELLRKDDTALCLFSAHWGGLQDAAFLRDASLARVLCIDTNERKLNAMVKHYPESWGFSAIDAFKFIDAADGSWDVVTTDCWSGDADVKLRGYLPKLLAMTKRVLIVGCGTPWAQDSMHVLRELGGARKIEMRVRTEVAVWIVVTK